MMTYNDLAKTFEMLAAKPEGNGIVMDWAEHGLNGRWGIDLNDFELTPSEIRMLAEMGWCIWCRDVEYEEMAAWYKPETASDEELVEIFNQHKSIYKYT